MSTDMYLQGSGEDREVLTRALEKRGVDTITAFLREHREELRERFAQLGLSWDLVLVPDWERALQKVDLGDELLIRVEGPQ